MGNGLIQLIRMKESTRYIRVNGMIGKVHIQNSAFGKSNIKSIRFNHGFDVFDVCCGRGSRRALLSTSGRYKR